jgi:hypothetical protein
VNLGIILCNVSLQQKIHRITRALKKNRLGDMTLYRSGGYSLVGSKQDDADIKDPHKLVGKRVRDTAFMSATMMKELRRPNYRVLLVIQNTAGAEGLVIESISEVPFEKEVLLQRGTEYEITKVEIQQSEVITAYVRIINKRHAKK